MNVSRSGGPDPIGDREKWIAVTVPCPLCEGAGKWHLHDGATCYTVQCVTPVMECTYCGGRKRVIPVWRQLS